MNYDEINEREKHLMLQEVYSHDHFRMMVCCILLNQTTRKQVDMVRHALFAQYPSSLDLADAGHEYLANIIKLCGFKNRRSKTLIEFAIAWNNYPEGTPIHEYPGIGQYAEDSWNIFVLNKRGMYVQWLDNEPTVMVQDKELKKFLERELVEAAIDNDWEYRCSGDIRPKREFVDCPICGSTHMEMTTNSNSESLINCTNPNCGSNGGSDLSGITVKISAGLCDLS